MYVSIAGIPTLKAPLTFRHRWWVPELRRLMVRCLAVPTTASRRCWPSQRSSWPVDVERVRAIDMTSGVKWVSECASYWPNIRRYIYPLDRATTAFFLGRGRTESIPRSSVRGLVNTFFCYLLDDLDVQIFTSSAGLFAHSALLSGWRWGTFSHAYITTTAPKGCLRLTWATLHHCDDDSHMSRQETAFRLGSDIAVRDCGKALDCAKTPHRVSMMFKLRCARDDELTLMMIWWTRDCFLRCSTTHIENAPSTSLCFHIASSALTMILLLVSMGRCLATRDMWPCHCLGFHGYSSDFSGWSFVLPSLASLMIWVYWARLCWRFALRMMLANSSCLRSALWCVYLAMRGDTWRLAAIQLSLQRINSRRAMELMRGQSNPLRYSSSGLSSMACLYSLGCLEMGWRLSKATQNDPRRLRVGPRM